jgi:hypothetical protein
LWTTLLVVAGFCLVARGYYRWSVARGPTAAVQELVEALKSGDRDRACDLLDAPRRGLARKRFAEDPGPWPPAPRLTYQIENVEVDGEHATARVRLTESGFSLRPCIELHRNEYGLWEVGEISHLDTDPRWARLQAERESARRQALHAADDELANELARALEGTPGVIVSREAPEAPARR